MIGLEFVNGNGQVFDFVKRGGDQYYDFAHAHSRGETWDFVGHYGTINIAGNVLKVTKGGVFIASSTGLGNAFTLTAGNNEAITAVWRIL